MSESLYIAGISYLPAARVAKQFGYTNTYLLLLAREGKIDGKKINARWYIDPISVDNFFKNAQVVSEARAEHIRHIRTEELERNERARNRSNYRTALVETLAILVIGLAVGATGYLGGMVPESASVSGAPSSFFERISIALYAFFVPQNNSVPETETPVSNETGNRAVAIATTTRRTALVIAPDDVMTTTTTQTIKDSFSDSVSVSMNSDNPDTGLIVPHFKSKDGTTYRFLMVPVDVGSRNQTGVSNGNMSLQQK